MTPTKADERFKKKIYSFKVDPTLAAALKVIKDREGIPEGQQIRNGIELWLETKGFRVDFMDPHTERGSLGLKTDKQILTVFVERTLTRQRAERCVIADFPDVNNRQDQAVDALATCGQVTRVALEHTLIEPFPGEHADAVPFKRVLGPLERDATLRIPGTTLTVSMDVGAVPKGVKWDQVSAVISAHLRNALPQLREGVTKIAIPGLPFQLVLSIEYMDGGRPEGRLFVARNDPRRPLIPVVRHALRDKLPKLCAATCDERVLVLEKDSPAMGYGEVVRAIEALETEFPELNDVDQIWIANTVAWATEDVVWFLRIQPRKVVEER